MSLEIMEKQTPPEKNEVLDQSSVNDTDTTATKVEEPGGEPTPAASRNGEKPAPSGPQEEEWEYISGMRLVAVMAAITLTCFLMLLDTSIVATVCYPGVLWK